MTGRYQAYSEYKDSGVKWLNGVPSHWHIKRIKYLAQLNPSKSEVRSRADNSIVSFIPMEAVGNKGELDVSQTKELSQVLNGYTYVADGDVMLAKITPCFENGKAAIASGLAGGIGFATTEVIPARPYRPQDAKFLYYLFTSMPFKAIAESSMYGAGGQKRVADSFIAEYHYSEPSESERDTIAAFLDHETARIDRLIAKQQRLIELLKEKRQAVISHAVTKGLDPDAPMKDSGVEWLGEVPAHWEEIRVKMLFRFTKRQGYTDLTVLSVYRDYGVVVKSSRDDNNNKTPDNLGTYQLVNVGDLVINKMKAWQGSMGISQHFGFTSPDYAVYRPLHSIQDKFLHYWFRASHMPDVYRNISTGIRPSQWRLDLEEFEKLRVFLPPNNERTKIVNKIQIIEIKYQALIEKSERQVALLKERRTALISAAVTGKIDVRDWKPAQETAETDLPMVAEPHPDYPTRQEQT